MAENPENKCKWKPKISPPYECGEPSLTNEPNSLCILPSNREDKDMGLFAEKVNERIEKSTQKIDLRGCYFPKEFDSCFFIRRTFEKPVFFVESIFPQEIEFFGTKFLQEADFSNSEFSIVNFNGTEFSENAYFLGAKFLQVAYFSMTKFLRKANAFFSSAEFLNKVYFSLTTFSSKADFFSTKFSETYFHDTCFEKGVNFTGAEFNDRVLFLPDSESKKMSLVAQATSHTPAFWEKLYFKVLTSHSVYSSTPT